MSVKVMLKNNTYENFLTFNSFCDYVIARPDFYEDIVSFDISEENYTVENGVVLNTENLSIVFWLPNLEDNTLIIPEQAKFLFAEFYEKIKHKKIEKIVFNEKVFDGAVINYLDNLKEVDTSKSKALLFEDGILYDNEKTVIYGCCGNGNGKPIVINKEISDIRYDAFRKCTRDIVLAEDNLCFTMFDDAIYDREMGLLVAYPFNKTKEILTFPKEMRWTPLVSCLPKCFSKFAVEDGNKVFATVDGILYDKNIETLKYYPPKKMDKIYKMPDTVKRITISALSECNAEEIVIGKSFEIAISYPSEEKWSVEGDYLSIGLTAAKRVQKYSINENNENLTVIDGVLYSKDERYLVAFPPMKSAEFNFPDKCFNCNEFAFRNCVLNEISLNKLSEIANMNPPKFLTQMNFLEKVNFSEKGEYYMRDGVIYQHGKIPRIDMILQGVTNFTVKQMTELSPHVLINSDVRRIYVYSYVDIKHFKNINEEAFENSPFKIQFVILP